MPIESAADRLSFLADDGEEFFTGNPDNLIGIFDRNHDESSLAMHSVAGRRPVLACRTSDVEAHALVKGSEIVRLSDDVKYFVKDFEHDGTGMTLLVLRS